MTLTIELAPDLERLLREEAVRRGQESSDLARMLLEERLAALRRERAARVAALMDQWDAEDAANPNPDPLPEISPVSLRQVQVE